MLTETVTLFDGEKVKISSNLSGEQILFIRITLSIIISISNRTRKESCEECVPAGICIWKEVCGVYEFIGDISIRKHGSGSTEIILIGNPDLPFEWELKKYWMEQLSRIALFMTDQKTPSHIGIITDK